MIVDAHHHFWDPELAAYPWLTEEREAIRRPFGPDDLRPVLAANGVDRAVAVEARSSLDETRELLAMAEANRIVAGVIIMANPLAGTIVTIAFGFFILAFAAIVNGLINLVGGFKGGISWGGSLLGFLQVIIGVYLLTHPMMGIVAYVPTLGIITIAAGIAVIIFGFRVKAGTAVVPAT